MGFVRNCAKPSFLMFIVGIGDGEEATSRAGVDRAIFAAERGAPLVIQVIGILDPSP